MLTVLPLDGLFVPIMSLRRVSVHLTYGEAQQEQSRHHHGPPDPPDHPAFLFHLLVFCIIILKREGRGKESRKTSLPARQHGRLCRETVSESGRVRAMIAQPVGGVAEGERAGECVCVSVGGFSQGWEVRSLEKTMKEGKQISLLNIFNCDIS